MRHGETTRENNLLNLLEFSSLWDRLRRRETGNW